MNFLANIFRKQRSFKLLHILIILLLIISTLLTIKTLKNGSTNYRSRAQNVTIGSPSYETVPFYGDFFQQSWGASPDLTPYELFWDAGSFFTNTTNMTNAKASAQNVEKAGKIPGGGAQRWTDTYTNSEPGGVFAAKPEFSAWAAWYDNHPQYHDITSSGDNYSNYGHISPLTTLDAADIPSDMTGNTYGDWFAYKWGQTTAKTGAYGLELSDFVDSHPHRSTDYHDFNSRIISQFETKIGQTIPGTSVIDKATYIKQNLYNKWTDFWAEGYAKFYSSLVREIKKNTGKEPLIIDQNSLWPSLLRTRAIDNRTILQYIPGNNIIFMVDTETVAPGRSYTPMVTASGIMGMFAAREPNARFGATLHSDDPLFWQGMTTDFPSLSAADQKERGLKELKRQWLETGWAHIADRQGSVRRAISFISRTYQDTGKIDAQIAEIIRSIKPTRPFGLGFYYSTSIERAREAAMAKTGAWESTGYMNLDSHSYDSLRDTNGIANDYFVSDAALPALSSQAVPAAWIVLERNDSSGADLLTTSERDLLTAKAPVLSSISEIKNFSKPLSYSSNTTGIGFYDQTNRLIITASNLLDTQQNAILTLKTLHDGTYTATDLFTNELIPLAITNGTGTLTVPLSRWDTRAFALNVAISTPIPTGTIPPAPSRVPTSFYITPTYICLGSCITPSNPKITQQITLTQYPPTPTTFSPSAIENIPPATQPTINPPDGLKPRFNLILILIMIIQNILAFLQNLIR